jgi:hypothetical protein
MRFLSGSSIEADPTCQCFKKPKKNFLPLWEHETRGIATPVINRNQYVFEGAEGGEAWDQRWIKWCRVFHYFKGNVVFQPLIFS